MKHFAAAIIAATAIGQQDFLNFTVKLDGESQDKYLSSKEWSSAEVDTSDQCELTIMGNNSLFLRDSMSLSEGSIYKPFLRGGSIAYDVNVSMQEPGCVAGAYLVATSNGNCDEVEQNGSPQCRTIDAMQANKWGFSTQANPCGNGTCDAVSQCIASMHEQGIEEYGMDAYGPGGTIINTNDWFTVKNEFISDPGYAEFWKIRTTLSQGQDMIVLENDCRDYLTKLNDPLEGGMGIVFANWDNSRGIEDFEIGNQSQGDCAASKSMIRGFSIREDGSTEAIPDDDSNSSEDSSEDSGDDSPAPEPVEPAEHEGFQTQTDQYDGDSWTMFVKGLDGQMLETEGDAVVMGCNNRAWVTDFAEDESMYWGYAHDYLGGSITFDIDLSGVACNKAAGMYLVQGDDEYCSWGEKGDDVSPQCSRIELMEANEIGFTTASYPCVDGSCPDGVEMQQRTDASEYGPGGSLIDTSMPFTVKTRFFAATDSEDMPSELRKIETCLIQGDNMITMVQDDQTIIGQLTDKVYYNMQMVMSNFDAGEDNEISGRVCRGVGMDHGTKMSNFMWVTGDSIANDDDETDGDMVIGEVALNVDDCGDEWCTGCNVAWYSNEPMDTFNVCTDYTHYKWGNMCKPNRDLSLCGEDDDCFMSWPKDDKKKWRSDDAACRPIPDRLEEGDYKWRNKTCMRSKGLCALGCGDLSCHMSFPLDDPLRNKSAEAMCRCKPGSN